MFTNIPPAKSTVSIYGICTVARFGWSSMTGNSRKEINGE
jgi:hypothetical protein